MVDYVVDPMLDLLDDLGATVLLFGRRYVARSPAARIAQLIIAIEFIGAGSIFIAGLVGMFTGMAFTRQLHRRLPSVLGGGHGRRRRRARSRARARAGARGGRRHRARGQHDGERARQHARHRADRRHHDDGREPRSVSRRPARSSRRSIVLPLLALAFGIAGMFGAYVVGVLWQGIDPGVFFDRVQQFVKWADIRMLLVKSAIFGVIVSTICCKKGFFASGGARASARRRRRRSSRASSPSSPPTTSSPRS